MKTVIFTFFSSLLLLGSVTTTPTYSQNLVNDGKFESTTTLTPYDEATHLAQIWYYFGAIGTEFSTFVDGTAQFSISSGGMSNSDIQLLQTGFQFTQGNWYRLSFDVMSDTELSFGLFLGENGNNYQTIIGWDKYLQMAGPSWQTKSFDFQVFDMFPDTKLSLEMGGQTGFFAFDNFELTDIGPFPSIGILGDALNGWNEDTDLETADGVNYTISGLPLTSGALKFRQANSWDVNWGAETFPDGFAYLYGPNIPVLAAGTYNISFNRETGQYHFECVENCQSIVGIIGTAVSPYYNWDNAVTMQTGDGINYFLPVHLFIDGEAKFIKDNSWTVNWGGSDFPADTAVIDGPNIPVKKGMYQVSFNTETGAYQFDWLKLSMVGTAVGGWDNDVFLSTEDGIYYHDTITVEDGELKFRANQSWAMNWGGWEFPMGTAYPDGPNIFIPKGKYAVSFDLMALMYNFEDLSCHLTCPGFLWANTDPGLCTAMVNFEEPALAGECTGDSMSIQQINGLPSGSEFPRGLTTNSYVLLNGDSIVDECSFDVTVWDAEPPKVLNFSAELEQSFPPNHKMTELYLNYDLADNCDPVETEINVYSDQSDDRYGDGHTLNDWEIIDDHHVLLRAERSGVVGDRHYMVYIIWHDQSFNYNWEAVEVTIPHDQRSGAKLNATVSRLENSSGELISKSALIENSDQLSGGDFKIWPNPSTNYFTLQTSPTPEGQLMIEVTDLNGKTLEAKTGQAGESIKFGSDLQPGLYIVTIRSGESVLNLKVIKH